MADRLRPTHLTIRLLELPTRRQLSAAHDPDPAASRLLSIVALHCDDDLETVSGWGECSALNDATYSGESASSAYDMLASGEPPDPLVYAITAAAIEMATVDAQLRAEGRSLADRLGTAGGTAKAGAVVGLGSPADMAAEAAEAAAAGFGRVKCKVAPGAIVEPLRAVRAACGDDIELQVDANASLTEADLDEIAALADLGVTAIEQPFAIDDIATAASLVDRGGIEVVADEAVRTAGDVEMLASSGAATAVVIKPPRLGGIAATERTLDVVAEHQLGASIGGLLESGLGRHVLAAFAPRPELSITGDLSPAGRWLAADPFPDLEVVDGVIAAPSSTGIADPPDHDLLERFAIDTVTVPFPPTEDHDP